MASFSLCSNEACGLGKTCYRRSAPQSPMQSWTLFAPRGERLSFSDTDDPRCIEVATVPAHCDWFKPLPNTVNR